MSLEYKTFIVFIIENCSLRILVQVHRGKAQENIQPWWWPKIDKMFSYIDLEVKYYDEWIYFLEV